METPRIDTVARLMAGGIGRRQVSRGLAAALLGGLALPTAALAGCKKMGKKCSSSSQCCKHGRCKNGRCRCKGRYDECNGKCYNLDKHKKHCGSCGNRCSSAEICQHGSCEA